MSNVPAPDGAAPVLPVLHVSAPRSGKRRLPAATLAEISEALAAGHVVLVAGKPEDLPIHVGTMTCAASDAEERVARRWLTDLTAGAIEHELDVDRVIAAVNALYEGGWPSFIGDTGPVQCNRSWRDDEDGEL